MGSVIINLLGNLFEKKKMRFKQNDIFLLEFF